jgi:hypothetical protein
VRERAKDGLEAFRVNRLRREADLDMSDKGVRVFQPDPNSTNSKHCRTYKSVTPTEPDYANRIPALAEPRREGIMDWFGLGTVAPIGRD